MPRYRVIAKGFMNGRMYDPNGKRKILYTDKSFPRKGSKKVEAVPSWLERMEEEPIADKATRETAEQEAARIEAEKLAEDENDKTTFINDESAGKSGNGVVETL
jgi:hypothetical protein